jgi:competence protein ComEA
VRSSARSRDDADVIRARLRALLAEGQRTRGWVPEDEEPTDDGAAGPDGWGDADRWDDDGRDDDGRGDDGRGDDGRGDDGPDGGLRSPPDVALPPTLGRHRAPGRTARLDPGRPGAWALWAVAVLAAAAVVGWTWLDRPAVDQVPAAVSASVPTAAPTSAEPDPAESTGDPVVVSVVGRVAAPGLVTLPAGSRVADALAAVGGLLPEADPASINAAAVLSDGQQIAVGVPGAVSPAAGAPASAGSGAGGLLDLNTATVADLDALPGIGPVLAQRIVDHRTAQGPFTSVDQLDDVSGIGPAIFADLVARVRV